MSRTPEYGGPDAENPEWTVEDLRRARRLKDIPELRQLYERLQAEKADHRVATGEVVAIRLATEVADAMQASGPGWQQRAEEALRFEFRKRA